jgi:polysaccharide pyruvyl transferase WcaK-like protein
MSFIDVFKSLRRPRSVLKLLPRGRCPTTVQVSHFMKRVANLSPRPRVHCFLGDRNVFQGEAIHAVVLSYGFTVTFSPGIGRHLDEEEIFHLCNFLDVLRANFETDDARRHFYLRWRDDLLATGRRDPHRGDVSLQDPIPSRGSGNRLIQGLLGISETRIASLLPKRRELPLLDEFFTRGQHHPGFGPTREGLESGGWLSTMMHLLPPEEEASLIARAFEAGKQALAEPATRQRILICGWYGTETLGDKAILGGIVHIVRRRWPDMAVDLASLEPYVSRMTVRQMPELRIDRVLTLGEAFAHASKSQYCAVAIGGGPLMSSIPWCTHLLEIFAAAKQAGSKCLIAGCGIGPLYVDYRNAAIRYLLEVADEVVLRDRGSEKVARDLLKVERKLEVALDPAFIWIRQHATSAERKPKQILLALRNWPIEEFAAHMDRTHAEQIKAAFERELVAMIEEILRIDPSLNLIPFCMHKYAVGGDDRIFYRRLLTQFPTLVSCLDNRHRTPAEDLELIARSRAVLAMRFHSVVFSLATNTPFLSVDYTLGGKIAGLLGDVGASDLLVPIDRFDGKTTAHRLLSLESPATNVAAEVTATEMAIERCFSCVPLESRQGVNGDFPCD